jgi:Xaa-Pro aminopeptidase
MVPHDVVFAGEASGEKRARLAVKLGKTGIDAAVLTAPDSIAWLLNVRGGDREFTPVALAFAILKADASVELFVDPAKTSPALIDHLGDGVSIASPDDFAPALDRLGADGAKVLADPATTAAFVVDRLENAGSDIARGPDPCTLPKACKNDVELAGIRAAHVRDGAALTTFLAWLDQAAADGELDEWGAAEHLEALRRGAAHFQRLSFPTIAGAGPHGAIVHYRVTRDSNRLLRSGELFLLDSGAQYLDGTTDVTRTVAVGPPGDEERDRFTRVLKGHIALATVRFPKGTTGSQLDMLARQPLWQAGLDYDHGTGHGVGSYLNVHEGPHRISKIPNRAALRPGMIVSNEPGYYKEGAFGIRIENLVAVREAAAPDGADRALLEFETLTLAPIDRRLIEHALLNDAERGWLDRYHARVHETITPLVDEATARWLTQATAAIGTGS